MLTARDPEALRRRLDAWRRDGAVGGAGDVGLVPTMGALHAGHLSLLRLARGQVGGAARRVVVSVFVNPAQFGPGEDFNRYPRRLEADAAELAAAGCDLLFAPEAEAIYPAGHSTFVEPAGPALGLEGERRPGHFRGVATVVCALLNLVRPEVAVFGEKDAQQLAVVRRMVRDLHLGVEIVAAPTVRETDGLAMSSRNAYLAPAERQAATVLHRALQAGRTAIAGGERRGDFVRRRMREVVEGEPLANLDYAEVVDAETFQPVARVAGRVVLPIAARIGATRLIDNLSLAAEEGEGVPRRG